MTHTIVRRSMRKQTGEVLRESTVACRVTAKRIYLRGASAFDRFTGEQEMDDARRNAATYIVTVDPKTLTPKEQQ